jgi:hypothetical protein
MRKRCPTSAGTWRSTGIGPFTGAEYLALSRRGGLLSAGRGREAKRVFRELLARSPRNQVFLKNLVSHPPEERSWAYDRAVTLGRLGRALEAQGLPAEALPAFQALGEPEGEGVG